MTSEIQNWQVIQLFNLLRGGSLFTSLDHSLRARSRPENLHSERSTLPPGTPPARPGPRRDFETRQEPTRRTVWKMGWSLVCRRPGDPGAGPAPAAAGLPAEALVTNFTELAYYIVVVP